MRIDSRRPRPYSDMVVGMVRSADLRDWSSPVHISSQDRNPYPRPPFSPHFQSTAAYMPSSKVYSCTRCLRRYSDRNELLRHKKEEHGKVTQGRAHYETIEDDICPYCHTRYAGSDGVAKHLRASRACAPIHAKWEQALSSAAPSTRASSSDSRSQDSDASDRSNALSLSDEERASALSSGSERREMEVDSPTDNTMDQNTSSSPVGADLERMVDTGGNIVYVERHPKPHAGQPIRRAVPGDLPESYRSYPDVGALSNPDSFEVAQLLMESGVSGRFRNRYLALKRVSTTWHGLYWRIYLPNV